MILPPFEFPLVIVSSPRCGSGALGFHIQKLYDRNFFNEPDANPDKLKKFLDFTKTSNEYIVKFLGNSIKNYPGGFQEKLFSGKFNTIKLRRENVVEQIASYYVAWIRDKWAYRADELDNYDPTAPIQIDKQIIDLAINHIRFENNIVKNFKADISLTYEQITENIDAGIIVKTPIPANYDEVIDLVLKRYDLWKSRYAS